MTYHFNLDDIIFHASEFFEILECEIKGKTREREVADVRKVISMFCFGVFSTPTIGKARS